MAMLGTANKKEEENHKKTLASLWYA